MSKARLSPALVVYLAVHKDCVVDADRLREALWPGRPPGTTLYTTASVARNHLGRASDGEQYLPLLPNGERVYRLGTSVGTDYDLFAEGVRRAKSEPAGQAIRTLRAALELVRGRPFESASRGYEWTHVEGLTVCLENEIADAIRRASHTATPNRRMVAIADAILRRNGRMIAAIERIGRGSDCYEGVPFVLELT